MESRTLFDQRGSPWRAPITSRTSSWRICEERARCRTTNRHSKIHPTIWPLPNAKIKKYCVDRGSSQGRKNRTFVLATDATRFARRVASYLCVLWCVLWWCVWCVLWWCVLWLRLKVRRGLTCVKCGIRTPTSGCCREQREGPATGRRSLRQRHTRKAFAALGRTSRNRPARAAAGVPPERSVPGSARSVWMSTLGPLQRRTLRTRFRRIVLFARDDTTLFAHHRRSTVPARAEGDAPHRSGALQITEAAGQRAISMI